MEVYLFYFLSLISIITAVGVVMASNPLQSALYLVMTMVGVAGLFFLLHAPFAAAVQILVYAGAVMVLFVMVLMLIDVNREEEKFTGNTLSLFMKGLFVGVATGMIAALVTKSTAVTPALTTIKTFTVQMMSKVLFTKYMLAFELLGFMLLVIPIGVVALSRVKGGTHDR